MQKVLKLVFGTKYGSDYFANINLESLTLDDDHKKEDKAG